MPDEDAGTLIDSDGDGLCDETEIRRGTDPLLADTDADGFTDYIESTYGFNALLPASPNRDLIVVLREDPSSIILVMTTATVRGRGEDYTGAFEALPVRDPLGLDASAFWERSQALGGFPADNIAVVEPAAERYLGVVGTTELFFETTLAFQRNMAVGCTRAYPFRYNVKRSDGVFIAGSIRRLLVILPPGDTISTGTWCTPPPPCI